MVIMHENVKKHFRLFQVFQGIERSHIRLRISLNVLENVQMRV